MYFLFVQLAIKHSKFIFQVYSKQFRLKIYFTEYIIRFKYQHDQKFPINTRDLIEIKSEKNLENYSRI